MKKLNSVFFLGFGTMFIALTSIFSFNRTEILKAYTFKEKLPLPASIEGRNSLRSKQLANVTTGKVEARDYYVALDQINTLSKGLSTRANDLPWENMGPDGVSGRSRSFIFDKTKEGRCYSGGVSGGIFVSDNLGNLWRPVENMDEDLKVLPIGCMAQSKDGDIYAGTGEYWGNVPNADFGSQFYGNGIYKKAANSEKWEHLSATIFTTLTTANHTGDFRSVVDMACDPEDNDVLYAGTTTGLFKSTDAGMTWNKLSIPLPARVGTIPVAGQVKIAANGDIYTCLNGLIFKSKDKGATWGSPLNKTYNYRADTLNSNGQPGNHHTRIALSATDPDKIYAVGITGTSDLKYAIRSIDGGTSWEFLGKGDAFLNPLCSQFGGGRRCQGWYDLCLAVHPKDDDKLYLGGSLPLYSWSKKDGWLRISNWYSPATLGSNLVHADMHEFAFHPTRPDTMVCVNDGGVYMTFNGLSGLPNQVRWFPRNNKYNITQFYDIDVSKYGELLGGAQDNGSMFVSMKGSSSGLSQIFGGGDGFGTAISAMEDYSVTFVSVYYGAVNRATDLTSNTKPMAAGTCVDLGHQHRYQGTVEPDEEFDHVEFNTQIHLSEALAPNDTNPDKDDVLASYLFVFNYNGGMYVSSNATDRKKTAIFTLSTPVFSTNQQVYTAHQSKGLGYIYFAGTGGLRRLNNIRNLRIDSFQQSTLLCGRFSGALSWTNCTGVSGTISDVYVGQNDSNKVVCVASGFGGTNKVFFSTNGTTFTGKQGNLPVMPIYSVVMNPDDENNVIVGTEFGIWETKNINTPSPVWEEQNKNIGRVPVMELILRPLRKNGCEVLYAGSHGRGYWRVPFPDKSSSGCDYTLRPRNPGNPVSIQAANQVGFTFNVYPNPATDLVNISFKADKASLYHIALYDMNGRLIKTAPYRSLSGENIIKTDVSMLQTGKYILRLENEKSVIGGKIFVKD